MTERLYYTDSYLKEFTARVEGISQNGGKWQVILDKTAFYPASGGQLYDTGKLSGIDVIDAIDSNSEIIHVLKAKPSFQIGDEIEGSIDWERRRDNMQKHTGQHILTRSFIEVCRAETISSRLGDEDCTIDINTSQLSNELIYQAEELANTIIFENRPVLIDFVPDNKLKDIPLRKIPDRKEEIYRIICIKDFDWSACGGTHCRTTGAVGIIKITGKEKIRGKLRFHFLTGLLAVRDYRWRYNEIEKISNLFSRHEKETFLGVQTLQNENDELRRNLTELKKKLLPSLIEEWMSGSRDINGRQVLAIDMSGGTIREAQDAALGIINKHKIIVLIGVGDKLLVAVSKNIGMSALEIIRKASTIYGGKGGGSEQLSRGGGFDPKDIEVLIAHPEKVLDI